ncbi:MAG: glycosyltransferase family 2 protein [Paludibacter sp.]
MYNPLVSIVIPTYCQPEFIIRAVESALMQDYENIEVIVSDDSPDTQTEILLKPYIEKKSVTYKRNTPRLGRVLNYRTCLYEYAKGEWLVNLDGDDYFIDKSFISSAINAINGDQSIVFVIANGTISYPGGEKIEKRIPGNSSPFLKISGRTYFNNFKRKRGFFHLTILYNTELARSIDFYRMDILSADIESILRLSLLGNVVLLDRNVGVWNLHSNNTSSTATYSQFMNNLLWIDSVLEFGKNYQYISRFACVEWRYFVRNNELTGYILSKIKNSEKKEKKKIIFGFLKNHPTIFFFPVFLKKLIQYLISNK